jgi:hypothetical protein
MSDTINDKRSTEDGGSVGKPAVMGSAFVRADKPLSEYPLGTKARAIGGGHWVKVERGWKWFNGSTFPRPGGDWDGCVEIPSHCP